MKLIKGTKLHPERTIHSATDPVAEKQILEHAAAIALNRENLEIIDQAVGNPEPNESLEDYLERAKSIVFDMVDRSFDGVQLAHTIRAERKILPEGA
jgi:hypothetical protein